ncbi:DUF481 domain-containing protein [Zooshikella ganghwensis]|nr:DUF481 domain-containing protein [Zooshikella ganghwensis]
MSCFVFADSLELSNGDQISGTIKYLDQEVLVIKTPYATIQLNWSKVKKIETKKPVTLLTHSGETIHGKLLADGKNHKLQQGNGQVIEFAELRGIDQMYPQEKKSKPFKFSGKALAFAELKEGNTESKELKLDLNLNLVHGMNRHRLELESERAEKNERLTEDKLEANYNYDRFLDEHWFANTYLSYEEDGLKNLNERTTLGFGLGYQFFNTPLHRFSVEGGLARVWSRYRDAGDSHVDVFRWATDYEKATVFLDKLSFFHKHELLIPRTEGNKLLFESETGLEYKLPYNISAVVQYELDYDNEPDEGKHKRDSAVSVGLGYSW